MTGSKWFYKWIEQYLFFPNGLQKLISILVLPLTVLYCIVVAYKRASAKPFDFGVPVLSIGNIIIGGSGKTPVTIAIAKDKKGIAIVLRGYGRKSQGLYVISNNGKILTDIDTSGDEAMLLALALPNTIVIVSENRSEGIDKAVKLGATAVILDDGFSKHNIKKMDILIRPEIEPTNIFCLPSGGYRETKMMYAFANMVLREETDFKRVVTYSKENQSIDKLPEELVLLTAISKPNRLLKFLPKNTKLVSFPDHHYFTKEDIAQVQEEFPNYSIITTAKDFVKLKQFKLKDIYMMDLNIEITKENIEKIDEFFK